ncbi:uncharacterized protein LOC113298968 isoform X2 [Papaver somniferum]|uniref:uncharacterized protein LOC113298968 isoform X2 n=1 Tax=Papaver somniferum TaxID=3469 RepID=UPI000E6FBC8E|nr:uncharacterized protein LOC113298968 isoform X2 [Papaver somniferum]
MSKANKPNQLYSLSLFSIRSRICKDLFFSLKYMMGSCCRLESRSFTNSSIPHPSTANPINKGIAGATYQVSLTPAAASTLTSHTVRRGAVRTRVSKSDSPRLNSKIANLSATRKERVKLPKINYDEEKVDERRLYTISEFLSHPSGVEAILNTNAMQNFESLDANTYRCALPGIQLLNFDVSPVLDLRVIPTTEDCIVEMLSCKFEGSQVTRSLNDHFSASMKNHITWDDASASEPYLYIDVQVEISLEIYTQPFTMLPTSAVEKPGNLVVQTLVDRLVPLLLQQLLQDYEKWVQDRKQCSKISS